jgi:hypothetical protein
MTSVPAYRETLEAADRLIRHSHACARAARPRVVHRQNAIQVKIGLIPTCECSSEWFPGRVGRFTAMHDNERVALCFAIGELTHLYHLSLLFCGTLEHSVRRPNHSGDEGR